MAEVTIRPPVRSDKDAWEKHWLAYLDFYRQVLSQDVTDGVFERLFVPGHHRAFVAETETGLVGFTHFLFHDSTWSLGQVCYLEDLYVCPETRGGGVGRKLIEAVYTAANDEPLASGKVYWHTDKNNSRAQQLYNRIGVLSDNIRYVRPE